MRLVFSVAFHRYVDQFEYPHNGTCIACTHEGLSDPIDTVIYMPGVVIYVHRHVSVVICMECLAYHVLQNAISPSTEDASSSN
jgi:hypothetical protein